MLRHLAADERAASLTTALGHALDELLDVIGVEVAHGDVVEEEQRLGALAHEIVDTHGDEVDTDGVEAVGGLGHEGLCADAIGGGHQHGRAVAGDVEGEEAAEAADVADDLGSECGAHLGLDALHGLLAGVDAHTGTGVGLALGALGLLGHGATRSRSWCRQHRRRGGWSRPRGTRRTARPPE